MSAHVHNTEVKSRLSALYDELIAHDGFAEMRVEIRLLKRGQKEVIIHCGRQYRFVIDYPGASEMVETPEMAEIGGAIAQRTAW